MSKQKVEQFETIKQFVLAEWGIKAMVAMLQICGHWKVYFKIPES